MLDSKLAMREGQRRNEEKKMELKMGARITALRKAKGMTQEQLANTLGISAPAVSKWETDSSYPDITMLCPLARALGTDVDSLLAFEEILSEEQLGKDMTEIVEMARGGRQSEAEEKMMSLLFRYPSNVNLKFSAVAALSLFEMCNPACSEQDKTRWNCLKKELAEAVYDSGAAAFRMSAVSMLVSLALAEDEVDRAEELLRETITETADFTMLWVRLYLKKGQREEALATVQRQLYKLVGDVSTCLTVMLGENLHLEAERAAEVCRVYREIEKLFGVGGGMGAGVLAEVCLREGKKQEALEYLEELADRLTGQMESPNPLLFAPTIQPVSGQYPGMVFRMVCLHGLKQDACFEPLRKEARFEALVKKLEESLVEKSEMKKQPTFTSEN